MELIIFHYHLLPGGVTGVIQESALAVLKNDQDIDAVRVVVGNEENVTAVRAAVHAKVASERFSVDVVPQIGYFSAARLAELAENAASEAVEDDNAAFRPEGSTDNQAVADGTAVLSEKIVDLISRKYAGSSRIWWVHNHHLGKNPAFTRAIHRMIEQLPEQRVLLHIHDFPECGRYANLRLLARSGVVSLYPTGPNVAYVTINSRDQKFLQSAGAQNVHYLADPFPRRGTERSEVLPGVTKRRLKEHFGARFPAYDPEHPVVLYPVRTIRRKNVLEAAFLLRLTREPPNLVVTLPGVSGAEKNYSELVSSTFDEGLIPGLWGIGNELDTAGIQFIHVQDAADAIISSSVQEGFGYQFASSVALGKPLIARYLDILPDVESLFDSFPSLFYREVRVPSKSPSLSNPLPFLRFRYDERLDKLCSFLGEAARQEVHDEIARLIDKTTIEFSYLPVQMQYAYLKDIKESDRFRAEVRALNEPTVTNIESLLNRTAEPNPDRVDKMLGAEAFLHALTPIAAAKISGTRDWLFDSGRVHKRILEVFARAEYQRLLYE